MSDHWVRVMRTLGIFGALKLVVGRDEILNGKTTDTNSAYFAKVRSHIAIMTHILTPRFAQYCFELGIDLKRIEVIADDQDEMSVSIPTFANSAIYVSRSSIEASRRMTTNYDFVISSGGIGPTHDGEATWILKSYPPISLY